MAIWIPCAVVGAACACVARRVISISAKWCARPSCLGRRDYCPIERVCVLRGVMHDALQAFLAVLDGYTLADLIKPQRALSLLLLDRHAARGP